MEECDHPDEELFSGYAQTDIHGGWFYESMSPEERADGIDRESYTDYMIESLMKSPSERFIPFENKEEWKIGLDTPSLL
jgi:hypothetical protein